MHGKYGIPFEEDLIELCSKYNAELVYDENDNDVYYEVKDMKGNITKKIYIKYIFRHKYPQGKKNA